MKKNGQEQRNENILKNMEADPSLAKHFLMTIIW